MSKYKNRHIQRKSALEQIDRLFQMQGLVEVIHYSCEELFKEPINQSPRITSIAILNLETKQVKSFSLHHSAEKLKIVHSEIKNNLDNIEIDMLKDFLAFFKSKNTSLFLHWNMKDINYGFPSIQHRIATLISEDLNYNSNNLYDLTVILKKIFGPNYISHPRFKSLLELNDITTKDYLLGDEEANAFKRDEFFKLHQSNLREVKAMSEVAERVWKGTLITKSSFFDRYGSSYLSIIETITEHWIFKFLGVIGIIYSIISLL